MYQPSLNNKQFWIFFLVLSLLSLFIVFDFQPIDRLYHGHDSFFHYRRLEVLIESIKNNTFPVYIDNDAALNFGYPIKWFYPDFILIPFAVLGSFIGFNTSYKTMLFCLTVLCGLFTYIFVKRVYKNDFTASVSALLFTFSAYRIFDLYIRTALGEAFAFTFIPIVFLGLYEIIKGNYKKWYILTIGFSLLILTHLLSSVMTFGFILIFLIIYYKDLIKKPRRIYALLLAGIVTIPLTAYFIVPLIEQLLSNTFYYQTPADDLLPNANKMNIREVLMGLIDGAFKYSMLPSIGVIITLTLCCRLFIRNNKSLLLKNTDIALFIGLLCIILTLNIIPWSIFPLKYLSIIQFPWRLLEFATFFFAVCGGYYLTLCIQEKRILKIVSYIIMVVATFIMLLSMSDEYKNESFQDYAGLDVSRHRTPLIENNFHLGNFDYVPRLFPSYGGVNFPNTEYIIERSGIIISENKDTSIGKMDEKNGITTVNIAINKQDIIELPLFYYKGYTVTLNGNSVDIRQSKEGLIEIPINESGQIKVSFTGTFLQKYCIYITLISFILLIVFIIKNKKRFNNE